GQVDDVNLEVERVHSGVTADQAEHFTVVVESWGKRLGGAIDDAGPGVIVQIRAHSRKVQDNPDPDLAQVSLRADAGQHQQLRGTYRARGQYDVIAASDPGYDAAHAVLDARATSGSHLNSASP